MFRKCVQSIQRSLESSRLRPLMSYYTFHFVYHMLAQTATTTQANGSSLEKSAVFAPFVQRHSDWLSGTLSPQRLNAATSDQHPISYS
jgi:hypothetical protein